MIGSQEVIGYQLEFLGSLLHDLLKQRTIFYIRKETFVIQRSFGGIITEEDFKTFYLNRMKKRIRWTVLLSVFIGAALILLLINPSVFRLIIYTAMYASLVALGVVVSFNSQAKQEYRSNASLKYEQRYQADEQGLHMIQKDTDIKTIPWTDVYKQRELRDMFLIYMSKNYAFVIPKRFFASTEDVFAFQEILHKHV